MKRKIFSVILCGVILMGTIGVYADSKSGTFGAGGVYANASVQNYNGIGIARTTPQTSYFSVGTVIKALYNNGTQSGSTYVQIDSGSTAVESQHYIDTYATFFTCYPN